MRPGSAFKERVYAWVRRIPRGRVATYGQIATLIDSPRAARAVGMALSGLRYGNAEDVPWQRVINAQGKISAPNDAHRFEIQRALLEAEGIELDAQGRCDLARYRWCPDMVPGD